MKNSVGVRQKEVEQVQEVRAEPFTPIDPPGMEPPREVTLKGGGGQGDRPEGIDLEAVREIFAEPENGARLARAIFAGLQALLGDDQAVKILLKARAGIEAEGHALQESVTRLLATCSKIRTPQAVYELVRDLREIVALIEKADSPEGEAACIDAMKARPGFFQPETQDAIRELCRQPAELRGQILSMAVKQARTRARRATRLGQMEERFAAALSGLDARTKAVLRIVNDAEDVDGEINSDFLNVWKALARQWPVKPLRGEPAAAELLAIHDLILLLDEAASGEPQPTEEGQGTEAPEMEAAPSAIAAEISAEELGKPEGSAHEPRLQLEKAEGEFRALVQWLQARTIEERVTAEVFAILLDGDISDSITKRNLYSGNIGADLDGDWMDDLTEIMEEPARRQAASPELLAVASYTMGMVAANR